MRECPDEHTFMMMLQGELGDEEQHALDEHLDGCPECSLLMVDLAGLVDSGTGAGPAPSARAVGVPVAEERVGGRYALLRSVGAGGMGAVYEAYDDALGRKVAIKLLRADLLDPELREDYSARLLREARLLAAVYHPNVLNVYDVGVWRDQVFMAIQFVEGTTLSDWIAEATPSWRAILEVHLAVGGGLAEAHRVGLIHRDIKPDNILIDATGRAWLADFGLARAIGPDVQIADADARSSAEHLDEAALEHSAITRSGAVVGTPAYMSPEQHRGDEVDERTDQFSLCAALFESLYDERPFAGRTWRELREAVCGGEIAPRPTLGRAKEVPPSLYPVLARGMSARVEDRYSGLPELLEALREAADAPPWWRRGARVVGVGAAFVVGASLIAALTLVVAATALLNMESPEGGEADAEVAAVDAGGPVKEKALSRAERQAQRREALEAMNHRCGEDAEACGSLVEEVVSCCVSDWLEGVSQEALFIAATKGRGEQLKGLCERGVAEACPLAAYAYSYSFHDYETPEGSMIPAFMGLMEEGCRGGEFLACAALQDAHADGSYMSEGDDSIEPSVEALIEKVGAGCEAGNGHVCWLIAESLLTSRVKVDTARAVDYMGRACERGWPLGCVLAGVAWRDHTVDACRAALRPVYQKIPENGVLDESSSWNDVGALCTWAASMRDEGRAARLWRVGCQGEATHREADLQKQQRAAIALSCELVKGLGGEP